MISKSNRVAAQFKKDIHCTSKETQAYWCNHCCPGKAISRRHRCRHHHHHHHHPHHQHHHHHHQAIMELGHLLTRSGFTRHHVPFMVFPGFFCLFVCISFLSSVIYYVAFCLYVVTSFFCIPVSCPNLGLHFVLLHFFFFNNQSQCILLFLSHISYLLPLNFLRLLL